VKVSKVLTAYKYYRPKQSYEYRGLYLQTILLVATRSKHIKNGLQT
jgi:hypothetical protein